MYRGAEACRDLTLLTIAKALGERMGGREYRATVIIDGLERGETRQVAVGLRRIRVHEESFVCSEKENPRREDLRVATFSEQSQRLHRASCASDGDQRWHGKSSPRRLATKRARMVLTSGGLEPVLDSGDGKHSVFAKALLTALRENRSVVDGQELFTQIRRLVVLNSPQTPEYAEIRYAGHEGGDFLEAIRKQIL